MRVYVQRVRKTKKGWMMRFSTAGTARTSAGDLITTVTSPVGLPQALEEGAKEARRQFTEMQHFNKTSPNL